MNGVVPARNGKPSSRYTWDEEGAVKNIEPLEKVRQRTEGLSSHGLSSRGLSSHGLSSPHDRRPSKDSKAKVNWPFHNRTASEAPSTIATSNFSHFRRATSQTRSWFKDAGDSASILSRSLVPDYVVHYMRGETPETLAKKREQMMWGERDVVISPQRETFISQELFFENPFGSSTHLSPAVQYEDGPKQYEPRRFFNGWRGGVAFNALSSLIFLLAVVVCFAVAVTRTQVFGGESTIFSGSCSTVASINTGLHVLINVLSIILLAGGNYVFQVLSSPTRRELTAAHGKSAWLDIGIPSLRNLLYMSGFRTLLAPALLLTTVATQVIYNAVIFTSQTGLDYDIVFITEPFLNGASFSNETDTNFGSLSQTALMGLQDDATQMKLVNLTTESCLQEFGGAYQTSYDAVLLVVEISSQNTALVQTSAAGTSLEAYSTVASKEDMALDGSLVQYCLARAGSTQTCEAKVSTSLLGIVALLNLGTFAGVVVVLCWAKFEPLATLGDAIRSFLRHPDMSTAGSCLLTKSDVKAGRWGLSEAKYFAQGGHFWLFTPSVARWLLLVFSWATLAAPTAAALGLLLPTDPQGISTFFGTATPYTTFILPFTVTVPQLAVLACLPQLLVAILYLVTNSHLTTYYFSHELTLFALGPRPLRVSADRTGAQTTSLYLTLPRPVSWVLLAIFVAMSFVLSQAVFPAIITLSQSVSTVTSSADNQIVAIALSLQPLVTLIALLFLLMIMIVGLGLRSAPAAALINGQEKGNPLALRGGSCSATLSAKCHSAAGEVEPWREALTWGVVAEGTGIKEAHCGFSALSVGAVDVGRAYA